MEPSAQVAHVVTRVREFGRRAMAEGLKSALEWRDSKFQDGRGTEAYQKRRAEQEARARRE